MIKHIVHLLIPDLSLYFLAIYASNAAECLQSLHFVLFLSTSFANILLKLLDQLHLLRLFFLQVSDLLFRFGEVHYRKLSSLIRKLLALQFQSGHERILNTHCSQLLRSFCLP